jgi:hypothetical protein
LFEIGLSFSDTPEKLVIPFNAIRGFYDPSVSFELEFDVPLQQRKRTRTFRRDHRLSGRRGKDRG